MLKNIIVALVVVLAFGLNSVALAISCVDPGTTPLDPGMVEDLRTLVGVNTCCCFNNDINVTDHDMIVKDYEKCCDIADDNCTTYYVAITREAVPYVVDEYINRVDENGNLIYAEVIQNSLDVVCICDGDTLRIVCRQHI